MPNTPQSYVTNLNKALVAQGMAGKPLSLMSLMPDAKKNKLNDSGGGHYNHSMLWKTLGPKKGGAPTGDLDKKLVEAFGGFDDFKTKFSAAGAGVFGALARYRPPPPPRSRSARSVGAQRTDGTSKHERLPWVVTVPGPARSSYPHASRLGPSPSHTQQQHSARLAFTASVVTHTQPQPRYPFSPRVRPEPFPPLLSPIRHPSPLHQAPAGPGWSSTRTDRSKSPPPKTRTIP